MKRSIEPSVSEYKPGMPEIEEHIPNESILINIMKLFNERLNEKPTL